MAQVELFLFPKGNNIITSVTGIEKWLLSQTVYKIQEESIILIIAM